MPLAPRLARKRSRLATGGKNVSTWRIAIDELTHTSAPSASAGSIAASAFGSNGSGAAGERRADERIGLRSSPRSHAVVRSVSLPDGIAAERAASVAAGSACRSSSADARRLVPGAVGIEDDLRRARQPGAQRLRGGRVADAQHEVGHVLGREALAAQQHVVVGDHVRAVVRAAAQAGGRLGEQRPAERGGQARASGSRRPVRRAPAASRRPPAADDHAASRLAQTLGQLCHVVRARRARAPRTSTHGPPVRAPLPVARPPAPPATGASGSRSGKLRCTAPGRPPAAVHQARQASERWWTAVDSARLVVADLDEPLRRRAVDAELVDRLAGADVAQLGRAVGGQHDQRHARLARLGDGGVEVGRGGARRCR